jgi:hypothetical protein
MNCCGILRDGYVRTFPCSVFRDSLVYFFLGTVARRASRFSVPWGRSESPVILVFDPLLARYLDRFYPFDTGALAASRLNAPLAKSKGDFRSRFEFKISNEVTPAKFVSELYGSLDRYVAGNPLGVLKEHLRPTRDVLAADETNGDTDYRRFSLECHSRVSIPVHPFLCEIWLPASVQPELSRFQLGHIDIHFYNDHEPPHFIIPIKRNCYTALPNALGLRKREQFVPAVASINRGHGESTSLDKGRANSVLRTRFIAIRNCRVD